ncbi:MAG TPA: DUF86 domain-containing protein [Solirubrobacterales bacterium]|nr:DUF86 domain-containing protein [Solirubrobacterales bacterium]
MVDARGVTERLNRLGAMVEELERLRDKGRGAYEADLEVRLATEHALQTAVQICIDVGAHLIAEQGLSTPADYRAVFRILGSVGLDAELAERLGNAAGMRNVIVHEYLSVDDDFVWEALENLDDLREFAAFTQQHLAE